MANQSFTLFDDATEIFNIPPGSVTLLGIPDSEEPVKIKTPYMSRIVGEVVMWPYAQIPSGWAPCDGGTYNGFKTIDLRGRFPVCAGQNANPNSREADNTDYQLGATGGINKYVLDKSEMADHTHGMQTYYNGSDGINNSRQFDNDGGGASTVQTNGITPDAINGVINPVGQAHENRPAYYALQFIQFIGLPATS